MVMMTVVILIFVRDLTTIIIHPLIGESRHHEQGNEARVIIG